MSVKTWANANGGNWSTVTNWTPAGPPAAGDDVVLPANSTLTYQVTLDGAASPTPALDSLTFGDSLGTHSIFLDVGASTLNVTGTGAGATDTITMRNGAGEALRLAGGTVNAGNLLLDDNAQVFGSGSLAISGNISGNGSIEAAGPKNSFLTTFSVSGTIAAGVHLSIAQAVANYSQLNILEILGIATSSYPIVISDSFMEVEIGPSGSLTINAAENISGGFGSGGGGSIKLEGAGSRLLLGSNPLTIGTGNSLTGQGIINTVAISGTGTVDAVGGTLELTQNVGASTGLTFKVEANSRLQLDGTVGTGNTFTFLSPNGADVVLGKDTGFGGTFSNVNVGAGGTVTNSVDIVGHAVTIGSETGHGTTGGTVTLSDGAVLHLTNLTSPSWFAHVVSDGASGTDVFVTDTANPTPHDVDGDGRADIVLQNDNSGQTWVWEMNGNAIIGGGNIATPDPGWKIKGIGDVNGDGKADVILQNDSGGQTWVWEMNGNAIIGGGSIARPDPGWTVTAAGDVNGDGKADIVLQNDTTREVYVWEMNGNSIIGGGRITTPDAGWKVEAAGDVNGDGKADIVLQNATTRQVYVWEMNGNAIIGGGSAGTPQAGWQVIAAADFTGDGKADILYQNSSTGQVGVAEMNGNMTTGFDDIGTPDPGWHIKAAADFTGHGGADILLQNDSGQTWVWGMTGTAITGGGNVGTPDPGWHIPVN